NPDGQQAACQPIRRNAGRGSAAGSARQPGLGPGLRKNVLRRGRKVGLSRPRHDCIQWGDLAHFLSRRPIRALPASRRPTGILPGLGGHRACPRSWHGVCELLTSRFRATTGASHGFWKISRRHLLQGSAASALAATLPGGAALAKDTVVGFVYVGSRDDYGYNQAHAVGAAALRKMAGIKVVEEEKVPETDAVEKTMESMINLDGATLLFPTSFGYFSPHVVKLANKYGKARFQHCGGLWTEKDPKNVGSYFGYIDEAQHVAGIAAASS